MGKEIIRYILIFLYIAILCVSIGFNVRTCTKIKYETEHKVIIDTSYNHVILDSIKYNIVQKDSVITKYKVKYEYIVKEIDNDTDSAAVNRFYELVSR